MTSLPRPRICLECRTLLAAREKCDQHPERRSVSLASKDGRAALRAAMFWPMERPAPDPDAVWRSSSKVPLVAMAVVGVASVVALKLSRDVGALVASLLLVGAFPVWGLLAAVAGARRRRRSRRT